MANGTREDGAAAEEREYGKTKGREGSVWNCCFFFGGTGDGGGEGAGVPGRGNEGLLVGGAGG